MKYCRTCLIPDTKPYTVFDDTDVCRACLHHRRKHDRSQMIDWTARAREFEVLVLSAKSKNAPFFDVVVPVSGGKDSITQVHRLLSYDLRILAVNVDYGIKTEIGHRNLRVLHGMGVHLLVYTPEVSLQKQLMRIGFRDFGDSDLLSHTLLHAAPLHIAVRFDVPLVLLGENSAFEYGGTDHDVDESRMTHEWFSQCAANDRRDATYISEQYGIPAEKLRLYDYPHAMEDAECQAVFMSYYFPWDSEEHLKIAVTHGFETLGRPSEGTYRDYVGLDEKLHRIHQYMKVPKFGYGRATDHVCEDIRTGRLSRESAKELVRQHDLIEPSESAVQAFITYLGITAEEFYDVVERFRNKEIWQKGADGQWYIPGHLESGTTNHEIHQV